jgi:hypothetical protein
VGDRITYVGLDVHKEGIVVAVAEGGLRGEVREYGRRGNGPERDKVEQGSKIILRHSDHRRPRFDRPLSSTDENAVGGRLLTSHRGCFRSSCLCRTARILLHDRLRVRY